MRSIPWNIASFGLVHCLEHMDNALVIASIEELEAFVAVFESRGFSAAARRLGVSTNAVSLRVQKLERSLSVALFVRTTRSVMATDEGRRFYARVGRLLEELDAAETELRADAGVVRGLVRIAIPPALATSALAARAHDLLDAHPRLSVQLRVANAAIDPVAAGVDIAVVVGVPPPTTLVGRSLGRASWVLAAAPSYLAKHGRPRTPEDLSSHRCLRFFDGTTADTWELVDRSGRSIVVPVRGTLEADDSRFLGDATYMGVGIGVRAIGECSQAEREGRLERVLPNYRFAPLDVTALVARGRLRSPRIAVCVELLRAAVADVS